MPGSFMEAGGDLKGMGLNPAYHYPSLASKGIQNGGGGYAMMASQPLIPPALGGVGAGNMYAAAMASQQVRQIGSVYMFVNVYL